MKEHLRHPLHGRKTFRNTRVLANLRWLSRWNRDGIFDISLQKIAYDIISLRLACLFLRYVLYTPVCFAFLSSVCLFSVIGMPRFCVPFWFHLVAEHINSSKIGQSLRKELLRCFLLTRTSQELNHTLTGYDKT